MHFFIRVYNYEQIGRLKLVQKISFILSLMFETRLIRLNFYNIILFSVHNDPLRVNYNEMLCT